LPKGIVSEKARKNTFFKKMSVKEDIKDLESLTQALK
jgi:hypothetical protein